jgi:hypothetical protein
MKRLGPELKMPKRSDLKVPPVLSDLYWDLRDRRLLPIVALLIVAIIAAPILLDKGSDPPTPTPAPTIASGATSKGGRLTVVEAQPGLRNPNKRFAHRNPTDPFKQRFTAPQVAKAEENAVTTATATQGSTSSATGGAGEPPVATVNETPAGGGGEGAASTPPAPSSPSSPAAPTSPGGPAERGGSGTGGGSGSNELPPSPEGTGEIHYFIWTAKVQIAHGETTAEGATEMGEPEVRESVPSLTPLPGLKMPVVTFIGVNTRTQNGIFLISRETTVVSGTANCVSGGTTCELVELENGSAATFEYGPNHLRVKLTVIATQLIRAKDPAESRSLDLKRPRISQAVGRAHALTRKR